MNEHEIAMANAHVTIAHYLISIADEQGLTHGEKHHLLEVAGMELVAAMKLLSGSTYLLTRNTDTWHLLSQLINKK